jgi:hypothetical protein
MIIHPFLKLHQFFLKNSVICLKELPSRSIWLFNCFTIPFIDGNFGLFTVNKVELRFYEAPARNALACEAGGRLAAKFRLNILRFFKNSFPDRHKNLWVGLIIIFILDRINRIDWIYCFLGFQTKPRNNHTAFSGSRKLKRSIVLLSNVHVASLFCFIAK